MRRQGARDGQGGGDRSTPSVRSGLRDEAGLRPRPMARGRETAVRHGWSTACSTSTRTGGTVRTARCLEPCLRVERSAFYRCNLRPFHPGNGRSHARRRQSAMPQTVTHAGKSQFAAFHPCGTVPGVEHVAHPVPPGAYEHTSPLHGLCGRAAAHLQPNFELSLGGTERHGSRRSAS